MCWVSKTTPIKLIAKEDIPVQKLVMKQVDKYISYFFAFTWDKDKCYTTKLDTPSIVPGTENFFIFKGFHSVPKITRGDSFISWTDSYNIEHILAYEPVEFGSIVNAIIPKGSTYYKNELDEYVSNQLILL